MKNRPIKLFLKSLRMDCGLDSIGRDARHSDQRLASWFGFDRVAHVIGMSLVASAFLLAANTASAQYFGLNPAFNQDGNILIADQFNNRVIEANPSGDIVWSFGLGPNDFSSNTIIGVNDAQRVGAFTLMAGTGTPAGVIPQSPNGAADNRVLLVGPYGEIVWQYGQFGQSGTGPDLLNTPVQCTYLPSQDVLITDQANNRIIEVNFQKEIVWQYPGSDTNAADQLNSPNSAELLENGHVLIADQGNNRSLEVTSADKIVQILTVGGTLNTLAFASRLPDGDTLLTDSGNARIVEVNAHDKVVWEYFTDTASESVAAPLPTRAVRLHDGNTLISDQFNNRVILIDHAKRILASYGLPLDGGGAIGNNVGYDLNSTQKGLYSPYDAKVVGDYTGLTAPFFVEGVGKY
ncbi:MAG TPA: hypothetical protein VMR33_07500 [Candidatus Baltobacteraceae bacterium]|jgi:hypothetical protein|nr:hypothetical protein [Candidatus Baltobacteraceae bacterium]